MILPVRVDSPIEFIRMPLRIPESTRLKLSQHLDSGAYTFELSLISAKGILLAKYVSSGNPVIEVDQAPGSRSSALIFLRYQGNHEQGQILRVTRNRITSIWENASGGGVVYEDFGGTAEILVGRFAAQVGLRREEKRYGHYFQEVYVVRNGTVRYMGVRRERNNPSRTRRRELIPEASRD